MGAHPCHWNGAQTVSQCDTWCATGKCIRPCCVVGFEVGWGVGVQEWGGGGSGRVVLIDNGRVYQSKAADALVQVKTTKFGTNVGLNMLLNISSRYFGGLFWSRQLRGLPSSDGYFIVTRCQRRSMVSCRVLVLSPLIYVNGSHLYSSQSRNQGSRKPWPLDVRSGESTP